MKSLNSFWSLFCLALAILVLPCCAGKSDMRSELIKFMRSVGLEKQLCAGVKVSAEQNGVINIADEGNFLVQYKILTPAIARDPNITIEPDVCIAPSAGKVVVVTHGWVDKAESDWPAEMASAIAQKVDPNQWLCASFDWRKGAVALNPVEAAQYARDIAGPRLAAALQALSPNLSHVHIIAHSAGAWAAESAAREIAAENPGTQIHLTFLDAYIPPTWDQKQLGKIDSKAPHWAEHYYTKDITFNMTQTDLTNAYNVDITKIDPYWKEHEFPYHWYLATVQGRYQRRMEKKFEVVDTFEGTKYGFERGLEAGTENFKKSLTLKTGNQAVKLKKVDKVENDSK
jgi:pimeloyl-ACP methyl ester carboxylesterase